MKIWLEIDVSNERLASILGILGVCGTVNVTTEAPTPPSGVNPDRVVTEEPAKPEKAKKGSKKKDEPAKPEEPVTAAPAAGSGPALTLEEVRARIIKACETIGTAKGLDVVEKAAGVRKAAQIDPSKFAAVIAGLDAAVAAHNDIG